VDDRDNNGKAILFDLWKCQCGVVEAGSEHAKAEKMPYRGRELVTAQE